MALSQDAANLSTILLNLTQPNTEVIKSAETMLKPILKNPNSIPALLEVLYARGSQPDAVRHVAAIILRKRISGHYESLPADYRNKMQADLLQFLASEGQRLVRNGAIGVTSTICKLQTPEGDVEVPSHFVPWPELFQFIAAASSDANPDARELAFLLLVEMTETIGNFLSSQFKQMAELFRGSITNVHEDTKVKTAAVKALGGLMSYLSDGKEVDIFCSLIPQLLSYSLECQRRNDEETVSIILDVLYDLAYSPSTIVTQELKPIVNFCLNCMKDKNLEINVRDSAALVIATMSESKPKTYGKDTALLHATLEVLFNMIENSDESGAGALFQSNPAWKEDDDDDDAEDSATETSMAQGTLDMLACEIPKKYIFQPAVQMCVNRFSSQNENHRKAGIACLGVIAEGCTEPLREHLADIMPIVLQAAQDSSASVRECACFTLGQLSEHCQPEILSYSSQVLPIAFKLLDDSTIAVQATSCYVLEMFCERLEPEGVRFLLDPLVKKLAQMLETTSKRSVQEMSVAALAATAVAAEEEFAPYVEGVANLMSKMMAINDEKLFSLRGRALECMGHMAIAVGKDHFRPYFVHTMHCACEGLTFDNTELHEFAYAVFANLAKVMGSEFSPCLGELIPHLLTVLEQDDGCLEKQTEAQTDYGGLELGDSDDELDDGNYVINVRTALLEAKKGAITAIGEISAHCGDSFVPFLDKTVPLLQKAAQNWHPLIKAEVAEALPSLITPVICSEHGGSIEWTKGDVNGTSPMGQRTTTLANMILTDLLSLMKDSDKQTVGKACSSVQKVIETCGPHSLSIIANECLEMVHNLLIKTAPCQILEDVEEVYDDEDDDHDSFMTSVCDLVGGLCRVMGVHFSQFFPQFLPAICNYAKSSRPVSDRAMAIGCLGEIAEELEVGIKDVWKNIFVPAIYAGLNDEDYSVRRNAAFCAGVCCAGLGEFAIPEYGQILQAVGNLFTIDSEISDSSAAAVDNACACVSRMIMVSPTNVPLSQVLPVILSKLPLKNDMTENETVYTCLLGLLQMNNSDALALKDDFKRVFLQAIGEDSQVDDDIKEKIKSALPAFG